MDSYIRELRQETMLRILLICIGVGLHLCRISLIEIGISEAPELEPNAASVIVVFSTVRICMEVRSFWPDRVRRPPEVIMLLIKSLSNLYVTELIMRYVWAFISRSLYLFNNKVEGLYLGDWLHREGFIAVRFLTACLIFACMIDMVGYKFITQALQPTEVSRANGQAEGGNVNGHGNARDDDFFPIELPPRHISFSSLPFVPLENLLDIRRRSLEHRRDSRNNN